MKRWIERVLPWTRSLVGKLEALLLISALGPLALFVGIYGLTGQVGWAILAVGLSGALIISGGRRVIRQWLEPLHLLNSQMRRTAAGDLRRRLPGVSVLRQQEGVAQFVRSGVDAIIISPIDSTDLIGNVRAARASGVQVVLVDAGLDDPAVQDAQVETDNYAGGQQAAAAMIQLLNGSGQIAMIGLSRHQSHIQVRDQGFLDGLAAAPGIIVVSAHYALSDPHLAEQITEELLTRYPRLAGLYAANEDAATGVILALQRYPRAHRVRVICWDTSPAELEALRDGIVDVLIVQDPWMLGYHAVKVAVALSRNQPTPRHVQLPTRVLTAQTLHNVPGLGTPDSNPAGPEGGAGERRVRIALAAKALTTQFWRSLLAGAQRSAQDHGASLTWHDSQESNLDELGVLHESFNQMTDNIRALVRQLQQEAEVVGPRAEALRVAAVSQATLAREQTAALERLSTGIERLGDAAQQIVTGTQAVAESAAGTLYGVEQAALAVNDSSQRLRQIITRLIESLDHLSARSGQFSAVTDVLRDIADDTHLLALNATIEAADAGVYGQRFTVVAEEVRTLAGQALAATEEFGGMVQDMRIATQQALAATQDSVRGTDLSMELTTHATVAIDRIARLAEHTNNAVQQITHAVTEQQDTNAELVNFAEQVTITAREAAQASAALSKVAQDLTAVVTRLQDTVTAFRTATEA